MHKELNSVAIFVAVADAGGFSKAAEKVGLTNSVISHHVTKLEESLGVTLLYRSTRQVTLSEQGREFYEVASLALKSIEEAATDLEAESNEPSGLLHIAMPAFVPDARLQELIWEFARRYDEVELKISFSDDRKKLISDGFDIAFRLGKLESSGLISRKISEIELQLVASPGLVSETEKLTDPGDISNIGCITLNQLDWIVTLLKGDENQKVKAGKRRIHVDNIYAARDAAVAGLGLIPLPLCLCQRDIAEKRLVQVLPEWSLSTIPLYAIWSNKARRNSLNRRLLSFLAENY